MIGVVYVLIGLLIIAAILAVPTLRFFRDRKIADKTWEERSLHKIENPDSVKRLSILPLVEYYTADNGLMGEPGVSYLITADDYRILFDVGYNVSGEHPSALLRNMRKLDVRLEDITAIFISHLHLDHVGGMQAQRNKTFALSTGDIDLNGITAYVPASMSHPSAKITLVEGPITIAPGIFSIGPINRALWFMGLTPEQAIAINVEDKGIVLVVGCGHQSVERLLRRTEELFDIPVYGVIGGLHYPVTASRMKFNIQRIFGTGKLPWQRITKAETEKTLSELLKKNLGVVGVSSHDSCDWTLSLFRDAFKARYKEVRVGEEITIS
ncbi:MAG: MBL fold metallo-hydrolase [Candidatus Aquicultor sp.]